MPTIGLVSQRQLKNLISDRAKREQQQRRTRGHVACWRAKVNRKPTPNSSERRAIEQSSAHSECVCISLSLCCVCVCERNCTFDAFKTAFARTRVSRRQSRRLDSTRNCSSFARISFRSSVTSRKFCCSFWHLATANGIFH